MLLYNYDTHVDNDDDDDDDDDNDFIIHESFGHVRYQEPLKPF